MQTFDDTMRKFEQLCIDREPFMWSIIWSVAVNYETHLESMPFDIAINDWDKRVRALVDIIKTTPPTCSRYRYVRKLKSELNTKLINNKRIDLSKQLLSANYDEKRYTNMEISKRALKDDMRKILE